MSLTITAQVTDANGAVATATATAQQSSAMVPMPALVTGNGSDGNPLAQRPVLSSGTLSWQGPVGGGASNGDYTLQSLALTTSGAITTSAAGQVIQGLNISGNPCITVKHNNVTIRKCALKITPANTDNSYCIIVSSGVTGLVVEDCLLDGNATSNEGNGIGSANPPTVTGATARRNQFVRVGQAIRYVLNSIGFTENFCTIISGQDADFVECYPNGGTCNNLLIQYNVFDGVDNADGGADSGVNITTASGLPAGTIGPNVVIDSNWFLWRSRTQNVAWETHSICNDASGGGHLTFTCTNNGIYNVSGASLGYGKNGSILLGSPTDGTITDSGNYMMATPTARTGTPYPGYRGAGKL